MTLPWSVAIVLVWLPVIIMIVAFAWIMPHMTKPLAPTASDTDPSARADTRTSVGD